MRSTVRGFTLLALVVLLPLSAYANSVASDKANKLRLLSMRMLVSYAQMGQGIAYANPVEDLNNGLQDFDAELKQLKSLPMSVNAKLKLREVEKAWAEFIREVKKPSNRNTTTELFVHGETMQHHSADLYWALKEDNGEQQTTLSERVSNLQFLTQRMALMYIFKAWKIIEDDRMLLETTSELRTSLDVLSKNPNNSTHINQNIAQALKSIDMLSNRIFPKPKDFSFTVLQTTGRIMSIVEDVAAYYEEK